MFNQEWNILYQNCYQSTTTSVNEPENHENLLNFKHIFFTYNTTQQKKESFEKNQQFLFNFGALGLNLFSDFSQNVRFLRYFSINILKTLKMVYWVSSERDNKVFPKTKGYVVSLVLSLDFKTVFGIFLSPLVCLKSVY
jgi:hypothetical protein